jgi:hypothetical protein
MKRILLVFLTLSLFLIFNSCDTPLTEYKPKNEDEKKIVETLQTFTDARNSVDLKVIRSTFHDEGIYYKGMGGELKASDIETADPEIWTRSGVFKITDPDIKINGEEALVSVNTWFGKGRFQAAFTMVKENGNWLIKAYRQ